MARPEEKAQNMFNKWVRMKEEQEGKLKQTKQRPFLASECHRLSDAERFRREIVREIADGVRRIQNAGMGEHAIRDLNDSINKLIREKWHWNRRIRELGGKDYEILEKAERKAEGDIHTEIDDSVRGSGGYRYFGAAKDLPGVKELFLKAAAKIAKRKRGDIQRNLTADYFGLRDEEDGVLVENEENLQKRLKGEIAEERKVYEQNVSAMDKKKIIVDQWAYLSDEEGESILACLRTGISAHDAMPAQDALKSALLEKKRRELLAKFA